MAKKTTTLTDDIKTIIETPKLDETPVSEPDPVDTLKDKLTARLIGVLADEFSPEIADILQPMIPALMNLAIAEGFNTVQHILVGLSTAEDTYPFWKDLIKSSTAENRIALMEAERQVAIKDIINKIRSEEARWTALSVALKTAVSILVVLL